MARPTGLSRWHHTVSTQLPHLSTPQVTVLVLWSVGLILALSIAGLYCKLIAGNPA